MERGKEELDYLEDGQKREASRKEEGMPLRRRKCQDTLWSQKSKEEDFSRRHRQGKD